MIFCFGRRKKVSQMLTIEEVTEEECSEDELIRGSKMRESLSSVQPRDRVRSLRDGWVEYVTPSGRLYYYNSETREKSWKPPRKFMGEPAEVSQSSNTNLPQEASLPRGWDSTELGTQNSQVKQINVGKILRTGILKTTLVEVNGEKVKKKWVKSFVVLTEFFILLTTIVGTFKKLFKKAKPSNLTRHYLLNAEVVKCEEASRHGNIYRLKTTSNEILFRSKKKTAAESWFHALTLVINNLKDKKFENFDELDIKERERKLSFGISSDFGISSSDVGVVPSRRELWPFGTKSVSLSDFSLDETDGPKSKCLSDYFGSKYPTPPGWTTIFDSETQQFCYVNCITKKKWFRAMTDDGHPYFYEEGWNRKSWLLPSIYLDVNSQILSDIRNSTGSRKTLQTNL